VSIRIRRRLRDVLAEFDNDRMSIARKVGQAVGLAVGRTVGLIIWLAIAILVLANREFWSEFEGASVLELGFVIGGGLGLWFLIARLIGAGFGVAVQFVFVLMEWLRSPADATRAVTPGSTLRDDRNAAIALALISGLLLGPAGGLFGTALWLVTALQENAGACRGLSTT
jgi:hypothetical protein